MKLQEPVEKRLGFELPDAATLIPEKNKLSSGLLITVKHFDIVGSTVFAPAVLQKEAAPFLDRPIGAGELDELRLRLTRLYVNAGYINSGVMIPDQTVQTGSVTLQIIEGRLGSVEIGGEHGFAQDYLSTRLMGDADSPLRVSSLQERMQLLLQNQQIERINAELAPGAQLGESILRVAVHEAPRYSLGIALANNRSPSVGSDRLELSGTARNQLGIADQWTLRLGKSRGVDDIALTGRFPIASDDTALDLRYEKNTAAVIEAPFDALDIDSRSQNIEVGLRHPLFRSLDKTFTVGAALAARESMTRLGGEPFSFSPGVHDGQSAIAAVRLSAEWLDRGQNYVFSARGVLNQGIPAFGATRNSNDLPDARFSSQLLQLQWVRRLNEAGASLQLRTDVQSSRTALFPLEKFALGGADSVRGFRENQLMRDNGWLFSAELRWPVFRWAFPGLSKLPSDGQVALALFADSGAAWDRGEKKDKLWSLGPGIRWEIAQDSFAQLYWAAARHDILQTNDNLQDRGIHFRLVFQNQF